MNLYFFTLKNLFSCFVFFRSFVLKDQDSIWSGAVMWLGLKQVNAHSLLLCSPLISDFLPTSQTKKDKLVNFCSCNLTFSFTFKIETYCMSMSLSTCIIFISQFY